jgi:lipoprotein-anchoring transpeptidase ErfK/SrfK
VKKLIAALFIFTVACTPQVTESQVVEETPIVLPDLSEITPSPTRTPVVVSPTPTPVPMIQIDSYIVQSGDTLTNIGERFGLSVEYLAGVNSIADANVIYPGQELKLTGEVEIPTPTITSGKQIVVKLSIQRIFFFQDGNLINSFIVSTGTTEYPTRIGQYKIWVMLPEDRMVGPGYDLPHVPWVMYFDEGRGFHGKDWNEIYGRPSSHGCVNMRVPEAEWLYERVEIGTDVLVIP